MHVLDNPAWHALTGPQTTVAERAPLAARYLPDVSVFSAVPDDATPDAWDSLRALVGPGGTAVLARRDAKVPPGWTKQFETPCRQMLLPTAAANSLTTTVELERLDARDVDAMLALVQRTQPGPFVTRTVELGTYLGHRRNGALIAMAGERMHPAGFTEISAVCTEPEYRGHGLASHLVRAIVQGIRDRSETPFLHLTTHNDAAHRIYSALGFETRAELQVIGLRAPS